MPRNKSEQLSPAEQEALDWARYVQANCPDGDSWESLPQQVRQKANRDFYGLDDSVRVTLQSKLGSIVTIRDAAKYILEILPGPDNATQSQ